MARTTPAVVFRGPGVPLEHWELPVPEPGPGEVLVRVTCCTLCGSDLHTYAGRRAVEVPTVLGHEIVGVVEAFGAGANPPGIEVGTRVTWPMCVGCEGGCPYCLLGIPQKCVSLFKFGHQAGVGLTGGLAGHCLLPAGTGLIPLPDSVPDEVGAMANCAVATVVAALKKRGPGSALVLGAGALGLVAIGLLSLDGFELIACDRDEARLAKARMFGATHTACPAEVDQVVSDATNGLGVATALEFSGADQAVEAAIRNVRIGGRVVLAGTVLPSAGVLVKPELLVRRLLTITGVHNYAPEDLGSAVEAIARPGLPFRELVGARYPLSRAEEAFQHAATGQTYRVAVVPG